MANARSITKKVAGAVTSIGASVLVSPLTTNMANALPNPIARVLGHIGAYGIGLAVASRAKSAMEAQVDEIFDIVEK